jgi:hypothetical protein
MIETCIFDNLYDFPRPSSRMLRDSTHSVQINYIVFSCPVTYVYLESIL